MLKKTIKYNNLFTGEEVEEDFYFHLNKAELVELEMSEEGGLSESLRKLVASQDGKRIMAEFKNIILTSYGVRSEDGRFFKKTQELRDEFASSEAYSALFMELVTGDTEGMIEFVTGIMPAGISEEDMEKIKQDMAAIDEKENPAPQLAAVPSEDVVAVQTKPDIPVQTEPDDAGKGDN